MAITANKNNRYFDYDGSLRLARQLWQLADNVAAMNARRLTGANDASVGFDGTYAHQFAGRVGDERTSVDRVMAGLRADAMECARSWKEAMDEQNRRIHGRHVDDVKAKRSNLEKFGDIFNGFDAPPAPAGVRMPSAPGFAPTATPVRYDS